MKIVKCVRRVPRLRVSPRTEWFVRTTKCEKFARTSSMVGQGENVQF
jgi:hypothetical protein